MLIIRIIQLTMFITTVILLIMIIVIIAPSAHPSSARGPHAPAPARASRAPRSLAAGEGLYTQYDIL